MNLERFIQAQEPVYATALAEIKNGKKATHWVWFIFPQLDGLGKSDTAKLYGLKNSEEAKEYLAHNILGYRLRECVQAMLTLKTNDPTEVFWEPDDLKFCSCLTLFLYASGGERIFSDALNKFYGGRRDKLTLKLLGAKNRFDCVLGAIIGDVIGAPYEFGKLKKKEFPLFIENTYKTDAVLKDKRSGGSFFTDDTVLTVAVFDAMKQCEKNGFYNLGNAVIDSFHRYGAVYPHCGFGTRFRQWVSAKSRKAYNSYGNGAAMRISAVPYFARSFAECVGLSKLVTEVTHNHPEGIKGAEVTAVCAYMALHNAEKEQIQNYAKQYYDLSFTCGQARPYYEHIESCQETVPYALVSFFESASYEDCMRNCVSLGGDADTLCAIAGSIAGAFYGIPDDIKQQGVSVLDDKLKKVLGV
ncbi:MAG: DUF1810 family protein [Clostridiales bacterium]|jgi:ADP-ribosylglycohydrolase|nr:DUF1810 family protein [Clostridiales bacterium]